MSPGVDPALEYRAAKERTAAATLPGLGQLVVRGPDRREFLQGLTTNDVMSLKPGAGLTTCILTPKGKLVASFQLYDRREDLMALCAPEAKTALYGALSRTLGLSESSLEDVGAGRCAVYFAGPGIPAALERAFSGLKLGPGEDWRGANWESWALDLYAYPALGPPGWILTCPPQALAPLWSALGSGISELSAEALAMLRVEAGVAAHGVDVDADVFPQEAGLEGAISFTKGCYMGQETISHIRNRGHLNRRLVGLKIRGEARTGSWVLNGETPVGKLTSLVDSPSLRAKLGLAIVRSASSAPGTKLRVAWAGATAAAEVVALPI